MSYENSVIYKLSCNITGEDYYGSTKNYKQRIYSHLSNRKSKTNRKCTSHQIIERGNYTFTIVENCNFNTKTELLIRERYYIENYPCINIEIPYRTQEEKSPRRKNELELKRYHANKDKINEKRRKKYTCECGAILRISGKSRHEKENKSHLKFILTQ